MEYIDFEKAVKQRMDQLQNSPEFQANCQRFSQECARLEAVALELYLQIKALQVRCRENTVRKEYASGSTLHRGFYCPSPTYDIIIGNTKRGKLLGHLTKASKPSHEYGFDADGRLLYCAWLRDGQPTQTEYLVYEGDRILGITLDHDGSLSCLTEETLHNGRITHYLQGLFLPMEQSFRCTEVSYEHYGYDTEGLASCDMHHYMQTVFVPAGLPERALALLPKEVYRHIGKYLFRRENGLLISYTNQQGREYQVLAQRNA